MKPDMILAKITLLALVTLIFLSMESIDRYKKNPLNIKHHTSRNHPLHIMMHSLLEPFSRVE
jgi:hypothetical protein